MPILQYQAPGHMDSKDVLEIGIIAAPLVASIGAWYVALSDDADDHLLNRDKELHDSAGGHVHAFVPWDERRESGLLPLRVAYTRW